MTWTETCHTLSQRNTMPHENIKHCEILLATALIRVTENFGTFVTGRVLLDETVWIIFFQEYLNTTSSGNFLLQ